MQPQNSGSSIPQVVISEPDTDASAAAGEVLMAPNAGFATPPTWPTPRRTPRPAWYISLTAALIVACGMVDALLLGNLFLFETQGNIPPRGLDMTAFLVLLTILLGPPVLVIIGGALAFLRVRWARIVGGALGLTVSGIYLIIFWLLLAALQESLRTASSFIAITTVSLSFTANVVLAVVSLLLLGSG